MVGNTWWAEVRARVERRAAELNRSVRSVLIEAGLSLDILYRERDRSHKIDTLQKLAGALGWSLPQILGFDVLAVPPDLVAAALRCVQRALQPLPATPGTETVFVEAFTAALNTLLQHRFEGRAIDENMLATLETTLAQVWGRSGRYQSAPANPQPHNDKTDAASPPANRRSPRRSPRRSRPRQ